jgi:hypothetical protein
MKWAIQEPPRSFGSGFRRGRYIRREEFRTPDGSQLPQIQLDAKGGLRGLEIPLEV